MSSNFYREQLLDHYHNPENFGVLEDADLDTQLANTSCGDMIHLTAKFDDQGRVAQVMFEGHGCVVSTASSSMFTTAVLGKTPEEIAVMDLSDIQEMLGGIKLSMGRVKCAMLPLEAMKKGLKEAGKLS